ncbi:gamma-glutamyl hydrolase-like [Hydractinia symbiolongicarpus]|uniref:gamma-glutamyl hydrolase-like n=1 Tax=Hydractinia symbiolongicarpus TaxID=13093 RepID=UPI00254A0601|nr:gamma-glutamyl hydrolase-like [Hydractinia symbiolongicarpus]
MADEKRRIFFFCFFINRFAHILTTEKYVEEINERPIVAVPVMRITDKTLIKLNPALKGKNYLSAGYVKFIEMSGGRVVPILPEMTDEEVKHIFNSVNGLLFPGGEISLNGSGYHIMVNKLLELAVKANEDGVVFPVLGICRGMQALIVHDAEEGLFSLTLTNSSNYTATVRWNTQELKNSSFLSSIPEKMMQESETYPITSHFHKYGVTPGFLKSSSKLNKLYRVLATSLDRDGKEFISILEGKTFPFYGVQFHPEKTMFEWAETMTIPHSSKAIRFGQFIGNSYMDQVRRNTRHFHNSSIEREYVIENYRSLRADNIKSHTPFQQIYIL